MWRSLLKAILLLPVILAAWHTLVRIIRRFYKFPIPQFLANLIDNPLRRRIQPPDATAIRHGIEPGMMVLDVGPGNGRYSMAAARRIGPTGRLHVVDIEPKMIARVQARAAAAGMTKIEARVASASARSLMPSRHLRIMTMSPTSSNKLKRIVGDNQL